MTPGHLRADRALLPPDATVLVVDPAPSVRGAQGARQVEAAGLEEARVRAHVPGTWGPAGSILRLVAEGHTNKEIGDVVDLSGGTVTGHLARTAREAGTGDRAHPVALPLRSAVVP